MKQPLNIEERLACLSGLSAQLKAFYRIVDLEIFHQDVSTALTYANV